MPISKVIEETMKSKSAGVIRKMFEEGLALKAKYGSDNVFDFSIGNPDLVPPKEIKDKIRELAEKCSEENFHGYMPNAGYDFCRSAMAEKSSLEQGVKVTGDCVVMSVGAAGAINSVFKAIINEGDNIIVPAPFFAEYRNYARNFHAELVEVSTNDDFSLNVERIRDSLTEKTAAVLMNSPNNPTGRVYSEEEIKSLARVLEEHGKKCGRKPYLICDEPYRAIVYDGKKVTPVFPFYDSAVVVTSFAKNLSLPGERIGYVCVNPSCPDKADFIAACTFTTRVLGYVNAPAFFQRVVADTWNAKVDYSLYAERRDILMSILDEAGIEYVKPEGAFYMWCKVPDCMNGDDMAFADYLKKYMILGAPGSGFGGKGWIRLAYCVSKQSIINSRAAFVKAMKDLK